ncbi:xanthine dehydrogenase family protein molybdopterin-binding subunit [Ramlibacter sp. XY19]|uniref:xanthine dehydrogenase family protein molybdopterin-binding subunit n=1 Tax=Ramlibacter paludis TaxID=2908000 RepID=UPI0023DA776A|nr:xanthine dehydrogenase family protein molybdopterin-binding subunit [Ramlibacter paludis]MCG2594183.1 xanthine dehydrogenase family protein molybdopterin-binding subunit [Ramlibacter paludis]
MDPIADTSRRGFLKTTALASGGLLLGVSIPGLRDAHAAGTLYTPNAWVHIADDNTITLISARSEMGQGVYTSMPMLIAEELGVDLDKIRVAIAPPDAKAYGNALLGGPQLTGGSTSVRDGWDKLRIGGAQVREMLITAAAARWDVDRDQVKAGNGIITGPRGLKATFGELAASAANMPVPEKPPLKDPSAFRIVGKRTRRLDTPSKVNGTAQFGIDVKVPGMAYAALEQAPVIGGTVKSFDAAKAKSMPGVIDVVQIPDGVAVVADSWWRANKARKELQIQWDDGPNAKLNDKAMLEGIRAASGTGKPLVIKTQGDPDAVIAGSQRVVKREYVSQLLSHSPLEPMNFTASWKDGKVMLIGPTQWQDGAQGAVAKALGVQPQDVSVQTTFLGGGFGRRIDLDFIVQAAQISKAVNRPVKLVWSREDDMTHDFYRPQALHQLAAALGPDGKPTAMTFRMTSQSITGRVFGLPAEVQDPLMTEAALAPYAIPAFRHDVVKHDAGLRVGYWRSVSHLLNAFANESFIDELAKEAGQDPYAYRMALVASQPRFANVLKIAADKAGWGTPLPAGRARGIALMEGYDTYMAQVAEVSLNADGSVKVHKVTVAADLGRMVNPDTVEAQIQSSVVFGMGPALMQEITLDNGRVQQTNFHNFPLVRMNEAPVIDITLVNSTEKPGGIGEPATAVVVPAIANAVAALTGKRVRKLPITAEAIRSA